MTSQVIGHFAARPGVPPARTPTAQRRPGTFTLSGECCIRCNSAYFGLGREDTTEVVWREPQWVADMVCKAGSRECVVKQANDGAPGDYPPAPSQLALEQVREP